MYSPPKKTMMRSQSNFQRTSNFMEENKSNSNLRLNPYSKFNKTPVKESNYK